MGQYSFMDCKNNGRRVKIYGKQPVYVLIPKEFGGGHIKETCYNGYGSFGGQDIYTLIAAWNRTFLSESMLEPIEKGKYGGLWGFEKDDLRKGGKTEDEIARLDDEEREQNYREALKRRKSFLKKMNAYRSGKKVDPELIRNIGIAITFYNENNGGDKIPYPVKITHDSKAVYEDYGFSAHDENQGW